MAYGMNTLGFTAGAMSNDPFETEEERRRRLEQEAAAQRQKVSAPTPVKQTITTDPITGEQKMTITGSPQDLSAANPLTPTIMPVAPPAAMAPVDYSLLPQDMTQPGLASQIQTLPKTPDQQIAAQDIRPVAAPVTAPAPVAPEMVGQQADIRRADNAMMPPQPAPVSPTPAPVETPALGQGIMPGETAGIPTTAAGGIDYDNILLGAQGNNKIRNKMISDTTTPPMYRRAAIAQEELDLRKQNELNKATQQAQEMIATGNGRAMAAAMKQEGSFLKAALFSALGAKDLARNELDKLGFTSGKWQTVVNDKGEKALINVRQDGMPTRGFNEAGQELAPEQLVAFGTQVGKAAYQKGETFVDTQGNAFAQSYNPNTNTFQYQPIGHTNKPVGRLTRSTQSAQLGAEQAAAKTMATKQVQLRMDPIIEAAKKGAGFLGEFNAKYGTNFKIAGQDTAGQPIIVDSTNNQIVTPDANGVVTATTQTTTAAPTAGTARVGGQTPAQVAAGQEVATDVAKTAGQEAAKSVEKLSNDVAQTADAAGQTAAVARRIRSTITQNPQIAGILTKRNDKGIDLITASLAFIDQGLGGSEAIEAAAKQMNFTADEVRIYDQIKGDLTELSLARARENKGQGTFTDFERRLFAQTTGDIARNPGRAIQYRMEIFEYAADKAQRKSEFIEDYRVKNPRATSGQIQAAWRRENKRFDEEFEKRMQDEYIKPKFKVKR